MNDVKNNDFIKNFYSEKTNKEFRKFMFLSASQVLPVNEKKDLLKHFIELCDNDTTEELWNMLSDLLCSDEMAEVMRKSMK